MSKIKPTIPKGTRDFSPIEMENRNYIFNTIKNVFKLYGYQAIETPSIENLSTLLGKYGDEGDKLIFKILNSGDYLANVDTNLLETKNSNKLVSSIAEKGLRYDLTVPFARYIVQHYNDILFPFKRYQLQPVWRADKPQKGRYREFYQCDADVIGSDSLNNEVELVQMIDDVFNSLNINAVIKLNSRKILSGIAEIINCADKIIDITIAIDKLDKIGFDAVINELIVSGLTSENIEIIKPIINLKGDNISKLNQLHNIFSSSLEGLKGVAELRYIIEKLSLLKIKNKIEIDLTLARGLNYYTGPIIEVKSLDYQIGSISGGGRYDNLTGAFGINGVSGVGISFGADRIYDVLSALNLFPEQSSSVTKVLIINFGNTELNYALKIAKILRKNAINTELYPDSVKIKKQLSYANSKNIPFVIIAGQNEIEINKCQIKDMITGEQQVVLIDEIGNIFNNLKI